MKAPGIVWQDDNPQERGIDRGGMQWFEDMGEYPRLLYRKSEPVKNDAGAVTNRFGDIHFTTLTVADAAEHMKADAEGWRASPDALTQAGRKKEEDKRAVESAKDDEIARLKAELARVQQGDAPRRGRPPKVVDGESREEV